ncbi:MAG: hypothetical protein ACRC4N_01620 [Gammaproteobacteria bacterium]
MRSVGGFTECWEMLQHQHSVCVCVCVFVTHSGDNSKNREE